VVIFTLTSGPELCGLVWLSGCGNKAHILLVPLREPFVILSQEYQILRIMEECIMGYENWPHKLLSPTSIDLDPDNPRLPGLSHGAPQSEVRREMFEAGKAREMIRSIAKAGYFPDQRVVVIRKESGRGFIVVEGNRRVCACQALLVHRNIPAAHQRFVKKWSESAKQVRPSFVKIPVVIAPSRNAATQLIVSRHLHQAPVRGWSRFAQGKFAINAFEGGQDIEFVASETGLTETNIRRAVQEARLFDLFLGLDWSEDEKNLLLDHVDNFPIEPLSRVLKSPATREKFGAVEFNNDGWPEFKWQADCIPLILKRLVTDSFAPLTGAKKPILNSRTANSKLEVGQYLSSLPEDICPSPVGTVTSATDIVEPPLPSKEVPVPPLPKKKQARRKGPKRSEPTLPPDIECQIRNDKASKLLEELQEITPEAYAHGSALLLRTLLEIALIAHMKQVNMWNECISKYKKDHRPIPSLKEMITFVASSEKTIPDHNLRAAIKDQSFAPRTFLNLVAHNDQHIMTPTDVRDIAARMTPLFRFLLDKKTDGHAQ